MIMQGKRIASLRILLTVLMVSAVTFSLIGCGVPKTEHDKVVKALEQAAQEKTALTDQVNKLTQEKDALAQQIAQLQKEITAMKAKTKPAAKPTTKTPAKKK